MSKITDKELKELTIKMMEKTTDYYLNTYLSKESDDINSLIEKDVAMRIVAIIPDRYTEVTVDVIDFFGDIEIATVFKTDAGFYLRADYEYVASYDPTVPLEAYFFGGRNGEGRGSKVETLPGGQDLGELSDLEYFQRGLNRTINPPYTKERFDAARKAEAPWFASAGTERGIINRLANKGISLGVSSRGNGEGTYTTLAVPAPTRCTPMTKKTPVGSEKATVDFSKISQLSPPSVTAGYSAKSAGYSAGTWAGVDLATVDVKQECIANAAKRIAAKVDESILADVVRAAGAVPTSGWSEEITKWEDIDISWKTHASALGYSPSPSEFGGVITTDAAAPVWYNPDTNTLQEMVEFTEDDLDLIEPCESEVMKFA